MFFFPVGAPVPPPFPEAPKPYRYIGFGDIQGPKPYKFIGFGDIHGPKPYKYIGFGDIFAQHLLFLRVGPEIADLWVTLLCVGFCFPWAPVPHFFPGVPNLLFLRVGPEIVDLLEFKRPPPPQNLREGLGGFAAHPFPWALGRQGAVWIPKTDDVRPDF